MRISGSQRRFLKDACRPGGCWIGNTNRTADALLRRGLIKPCEYSQTYRVRYEATDSGIELLRPEHDASETASRLVAEKASTI